MKLGGEFSRAPIRMDRLQGLGSRATNVHDARLRWRTVDKGGSWRTSNPPSGKGAPSGGDFLCEAGLVEWRNANRVSLGSSAGEWRCFFKADIGQ